MVYTPLRSTIGRRPLCNRRTGMSAAGIRAGDVLSDLPRSYELYRWHRRPWSDLRL